MIVRSLKFLSDYKQFKEGQEYLFSGTDNKESKDTESKFSVLVGRNGSGKTTLMSLIPTLFHHLERYSGRIPANFELQYTIKSMEVIIKHFDNVIYVSVSNKYDNVQLVPRRNSRSNDFSEINRHKPYIEYYLFHEFTPTSIVTSTFSLHGEYPSPRPFNYIGHQIVSDQSITNIYGVNHWRMGSISRGILRFLKLFFESESEIRDLLNLFDLEFTNRVEYKYNGMNSEWMIVSRSWLRNHNMEIQVEEAYLNDLEFKRDKRTITLNNMSSGEKMLLLRAISILNSIEKDSVVIIEEPELHLDQVWNRQLMTLFQILYKKYGAHIIIATHDYSIIRSVPKTNLILLQYGQNKSINGSTFLASYDELFNVLYGDKFRLNRIEEHFLATISEKDTDTLKRDYEKLGNSIFKYLVYREIEMRKA